VWSAFIWLRIETGGELLWMRKWKFVIYKNVNFLASCATIGFLRLSLLHGVSTRVLDRSCVVPSHTNVKGQVPCYLLPSTLLPSINVPYNASFITWRRSKLLLQQELRTLVDRVYFTSSIRVPLCLDSIVSLEKRSPTSLTKAKIFALTAPGRRLFNLS
jgi:hypothetical protein